MYAQYLVKLWESKFWQK